MKKTLIYLGTLAVTAALASCSIGCADSPGNPLAPTRTVVLTEGPFTCFTQPRGYCSQDLVTCWQEVDTYEQAEACPLIRIK